LSLFKKYCCIVAVRQDFLIFKLQIIQQYAICYAVISLGCVVIKNDADDLPVAYICPTLMVWNYVHCDPASDNALW